MDELKNKIIEEWLPLRDCYGCGKNDYCKFADKVNPDSQCGITIEALNQFITNTFPKVINSTDHQKQMYLDSLYYFCKYVRESEQVNSLLINKEKFIHWGWDLKAYSSQILPIRETLNELSKTLKEIPDLHHNTSILLVEGQSEMVFINYLRSDGNAFRLWAFQVDCYYGKDNKKPGKIKLLLDKYKQLGYDIYLQGDEDGNGDGSGYDKFKTFIDNGYISKENVFQFKYDLESAIPKIAVYNFLKKEALLKDVQFSYFDLKTQSNSINKCLLADFGIDTTQNNLKKKLSEYAGRKYFFIQNNERETFRNTELGKFADFLSKLK